MALKLKDKISKQDTAAAHVRVLHPEGRHATRTQSSGIAKARVGKVATVGHFSPELSLQVKQLGLNLGGRTVQSLMGEAWDLLFEKHGLPTFNEGDKPDHH